MSPFAETPHLWLTGHLQRLHQIDQAIKIQALARGYLARCRLEKQQAQPVTLAETLNRFGLDVWAQDLPTAAEALQDMDLDRKRQDALWHARVSLRLTGRADHIQDLESADYHERSRVLQETTIRVDTPASFWDRVKKFVWD
jgi:hypothetical protein